MGEIASGVPQDGFCRTNGGVGGDFDYGETDRHAGSSEFNEMTAGLGHADNHIYFVFQNQLELEKSIEKIKIQLSLKTDFNLIDAFRIFNETGTGTASI